MPAPVYAAIHASRARLAQPGSARAAGIRDGPVGDGGRRARGGPLLC